MKAISVLLCALIFPACLPAADQVPPNRLIDYDGFLKDAADVGKLRAQHRVSEEEFLRMAAEPDTIIFDARSDAKFRMLHVKGARHLSLPDTSAADLAKVIPDKNTRILIYCNNNFLNEPVSMVSKVATASLNIYTFNTLYSYGYRNVYELGPLVDIRKSKLPFEGTLAQPKK